jgi:hypothetical protein
MGITGLTGALLPYCSEISLGCRSPECQQRREQPVSTLVEATSTPSRAMIIDGWSLVYNIYRNLSVAQYDLPNVPKGVGRWPAVTSYEDVAEGCVTLLDWLCASGNEM